MKDKNSNRLTFLALIVSIVSVTIGFAAFTSTLTIKSSAEVIPDNLLEIVFSTSDTAEVTNPVHPTIPQALVGTVTATDAVIDNSDAANPEIRNLHAVFTEPDQSVTYSFYSYNKMNFAAYLTGIGYVGSKTCTIGTASTQTIVDNACAGVNVSVKVGTMSTVNSSTTGINGHILPSHDGEQVIVTISYDAGSAVADGSFTVNLPDIKLYYNSQDINA